MVLKRLRTVRVGIVSDTHGHLDERIAQEITRCDVAVHAGDIMGASVLEDLQPRSGHVAAVRGNNDIPTKWPVGEHDTLSTLPLEASLELPGGRIDIVHGDRHWSPGLRHERLRHCFADARAIVCGHSHRLTCDQGAEPWVLNPGASGRVRTFGGPSCLILTARSHDWRIDVLRFHPLCRTASSA